MKNYKIEIEIVEGRGGQWHKEGEKIVLPDFSKEGICAWMYRGDGSKSIQKGQVFRFPEDNGKLCPWLLSSLDPFITALRYGATLPWLYRGTPYEKTIDPDGVTTEFVRCPDPSASGIVVKLIRTCLPE
jgi:uncharacterized repeat protein (TIGR04076 family)